MPCNSEYLRRSDYEAELQRAARLLVYAWRWLGEPVQAWAEKAAKDHYGNPGYDEPRDRAVTELCALLKSLHQVTRAELLGRNVRNAHDLAMWWEDHQAADAERERKEARVAEQARVREQALAKLTPAERDALGPLAFANPEYHMASRTWQEAEIDD